MHVSDTIYTHSQGKVDMLQLQELERKKKQPTNQYSSKKDDDGKGKSVKFDCNRKAISKMEMDYLSKSEKACRTYKATK